jgi:hypothetical protein
MAATEHGLPSTRHVGLAVSRQVAASGQLAVRHSLRRAAVFLAFPPERLSFKSVETSSVRLI